MTETIYYDREMFNQTQNTMNHSENLSELFKALAKFQGDCPTVTKDATVSVTTRNGGKYTFSYATLGNILETTKDTLAENGLAVLQFTETDGVTTMITHSSGQWIRTEPLKLLADPRTDKEGNILPPTPQDVGSTLSYAKRYQLAGMLKVDAISDDDANLASGNTAEKKDKGSKPKKSTKKETPEPKQESVDLSDAESPQQALEILREQYDSVDEQRTALLAWYTPKQKEDADFKKKYHSEMMQRMQNPKLEIE